jgi:hypothetical protein
MLLKPTRYDPWIRQSKESDTCTKRKPIFYGLESNPAMTLPMLKTGRSKATGARLKG